ncbi:hypothetical protein Tco_0457227, partial [Tanacetum coccineum]
MCLTKGITDFRNEVITIYPKLDHLSDSSIETEKIDDDWDLLLEIEGVEILPFEEACRDALAIDICKRFSILEEERPVIETMAYS